MEQCPRGDVRDGIKTAGQEVSLGEAELRQVIFLPSLSALVQKRENKSINHLLSGWVNAKKFYDRNFPRQEARN